VELEDEHRQPAESVAKKSEFELSEVSEARLPRGRVWGCGVCIVLLLLGCWWFWWPIWFTLMGGRYIGGVGSKYSTTRFEFRYGHATRIVDDPHNRMQWIIGDLPDSITVTDGQRVIVYDHLGAIIKSSGDSMEVQYDSFKHKGWMGVRSDGTYFTIDSQGVVQE